MTEPTEECTHCRAIDDLIALFLRQRRTGHIGSWLNGIVDGLCVIAAEHAKPGHENILRDLLAARFVNSFATSLTTTTRANSQRETVQ